MGRAHDIKRTLPLNLAANKNYPLLQFVIFNYNSSDDLHAYMMSRGIAPYIRSGRIKYLRTREPRFFSMAHSRNIAFQSADGDIVTNVDADNFTGQGFAEYLNRLADICPRRAFFSRGKRRIHGRIGMYRDEFVEIGGYDEDLQGYGFDDRSLLLRAMYSGHKLMWWARAKGRDFARRIPTPRDLVGRNMEDPDWKSTEAQNRVLALKKIAAGELVANQGREWGRCGDLECWEG